MHPTLLFVIFGWPERSKEYGVVTPEYCGHCRNEARFSLVKTRRWGSLFFIPVLPLSSADYYLVCEVCHAAAEIEDENVEDCKEMVRTTREFVKGELSNDEYNAAVQEFRAEFWDYATEDADSLAATGEPGTEMQQPAGSADPE